MIKTHSFRSVFLYPFKNMAGGIPQGLRSKSMLKSLLELVRISVQDAAIDSHHI